MASLGPRAISRTANGTSVIGRKVALGTANGDATKVASEPLRLDVISSLRYLQAFVPISTVLGLIGGSLVAGSLCWGAARLVRQHPYILTFFVGIGFLVCAALACREGVLSFLPAGAQVALTKLTLFDLWTDNTALQNFFRRWGRVQLLTTERSEAEVRAIIRGLDPEFVESVLTRNLVELMPTAAHRVLMPESPTSAAGLNGHASPAVLRNGIHAREELTPAIISDIVRERAQARQLKVTEPEFLPALFGAIVASVTDGVQRASLWGARICAASSALWFGSFGLLSAKIPRTFILRSLSKHSVTEANAAHAARVAGALGLLSAGASIVFAAFSRRYRFRPQVLEANPQR